MLCIKHMEFKLDRRRVNRAIVSIYSPFTGPKNTDGMCVNKLNVMALSASQIVKSKYHIFVSVKHYSQLI